jgi:hypothetical protein
MSHLKRHVFPCLIGALCMLGESSCSPLSFTMEEPKRVSFSSSEPAQKKQSLVSFSRRYSMQNAKKTMSDAAVRLARIISRTQSGMPVSQLQHLLQRMQTTLVQPVDASATSCAYK